MQPEKHIRIHRFRNYIALDSENMTDTIYLDLDMTNKLIAALEKYRFDLTYTDFVDSKLGTQTIYREDNNGNE